MPSAQSNPAGQAFCDVWVTENIPGYFSEVNWIVLPISTVWNILYKIDCHASASKSVHLTPVQLLTKILLTPSILAIIRAGDNAVLGASCRPDCIFMHPCASQFGRLHFNLAGCISNKQSVLCQPSLPAVCPSPSTGCVANPKPVQSLLSYLAKQHTTLPCMQVIH